MQIKIRMNLLSMIIVLDSFFSKSTNLPIPAGLMRRPDPNSKDLVLPDLFHMNTPQLVSS